MFTFLAPYITKILLGVIALLVVATTVQTVRLKWTQKDLTVAKASASTMSMQIEVQNGAVAALEQQGKEMEDKVANAQQQAADLREKNRKALDALKKLKVPENCIEATAWAAQQAKEIADAW